VGTISASTLSQASSAVTDSRGNSTSTSRPEQTSFASVLGAQTEAGDQAGDPPTQSVDRSPLELPGKDAVRSRKETKRPKQESGPGPSANRSVEVAPASTVSPPTPPAQPAMMLGSNVCGGAVIASDISESSLAANLENETSTATASDLEETNELFVGQASGRETLVSCPTALTPTEQTPAEADEDLQATTDIQETTVSRDTLSPEGKNVVEPNASVSGSLDDTLAATSAAGSLFASVPNFMAQIAPEVKAQSASDATTACQIPEAATTAAATVPALSPAAGSSVPQPPDHAVGVSAGQAGQPGPGQPTGPIQAAGNGLASIAVTAPVEGSSNPTIVPATARSRTSDHVSSTPGTKKESARPSTPIGGDDANSSQDWGSTPTNMASLAQGPPVPTIGTMHPTAAYQPSSSTPIQPVASPAVLGSTQSTNGKANAATNPLHNDSPSPQPDSPTLPAPTLQAGRILERMGQSEMHVGVKTVDFGTIEVHTSLSQDRVGASLSTSHADLRSAMEAELPSLQQAISRHHLQLDAFDVAPHAGGQGGDSPDHSRSRSFTNEQTGPMLPSRESESALSAPTSSSWMSPHSSRLSVIA
jgi:hypothetical protein